MGTSLRAAVAACALLAAGCADTTAPPLEPLVAVAGIEVLTLHATRPWPGYHAACQTGAGVRLSAQGSSDPSGRALSFQWTDTVYGQPTVDFGPAGAIRTTNESAPALLGTIGEHEIHLLVTTQDGRKARASVLVLVTPCEECGTR
jgi:hypothetical protein